jgi:acetyl esterase/lipase
MDRVASPRTPGPGEDVMCYGSSEVVMHVVKRTGSLLVVAMCLFGLCARRTEAQSTAKFTRQSDVIYGRKAGVALTMEVFTPDRVSGLGVVWVVSSSGVSSREQTLQESFVRRISPLLERGFTVFATVHGSAPIFNVQDMVADITRAVRFVRYRAADFKVDDRRLGLAASSSGGLLALMVAVQGDDGRPAAARCGRPRVEPGSGSRLFLPADQSLEFRRRGSEHRRPDAETEWNSRSVVSVLRSRDEHRRTQTAHRS